MCMDRQLKQYKQQLKYRYKQSNVNFASIITDGESDGESDESKPATGELAVALSQLPLDYGSNDIDNNSEQPVVPCHNVMLLSMYQTRIYLKGHIVQMNGITTTMSMKIIKSTQQLSHENITIYIRIGICTTYDFVSGYVQPCFHS